MKLTNFMPESYKPIIAELESMVKGRGLEMKLGGTSGIGHDAESPVLLDYIVEGTEGRRILIMQSLDLDLKVERGWFSEVRGHSGIYPIEDMAPKVYFSLKPTLAVNYEGPSNGAFVGGSSIMTIEMGIRLDGTINTRSTYLFLQGNYRTAFAKLLDMLEGKEP